MDDDRTHPEPELGEPEHLEPAELDELLSAELDDELDAAARERGASVEAVTARMNATPGAEARRTALTAARDLLTEAPEIDELLAQRLRAKAVRAAAEQHAASELDRRRRRRQTFLAAGAVAAAAVGVVALVGDLGRGGGSNTASRKSSELAPPVAGATGAAGNSAAAPAALGAYFDKRTLADAALVHSAVAADGSTGYAANRTQSGNLAPQPAGTPQPASAAASGQADSLARNSQGLEKAAAATSTLPAGSACPTPAGIAKGDKLVLRATATLSGKPVLVFVFSGHGEHAVEIEDTHCALVDVEMRS